MVTGLARTVMVQGTASSVGKSLLVAGLCRYFARLGLRVAPFKSQNMALNSFATPDGLEIGRAQALQAQAAGVAPHVDMNPILLKPEGDMTSQVVVMGQPRARLSAQAYYDRKREFADVIGGALTRLRERNDVVVIEGAGSPAEINLQDRDVANMFVADLADAPVLLAGDIDRGGVFAAFVGTLMLLAPEHRARVKGLIINKFRGDLGLLTPGLDMLEARAECPVLGVVPFLGDLGLPEEDSVALEQRLTVPDTASLECLDVAVVMFPYISNYDDLLPLENEPGVRVRYVGSTAELGTPDLLILPGTKRTFADLDWLQANGLAEQIVTRAAEGLPVLGVCGGFQMLGERLADPTAVEGQGGERRGLGLLPCQVQFEATKVTRQVQGYAQAAFLTDGQALSAPTTGYYIHMGRVQAASGAQPLFVDGQGEAEGCVHDQLPVAGTMMHGLLDQDLLRRRLIEYLRRRRGWDPTYQVRAHDLEAPFERLADCLCSSLNLDQLHRIVGVEAPQ